MSIEKALIAAAPPYFLAAKAQALIQREAAKGCSAVIYPYPVPIEPPFKPVSTIESPAQNSNVGEIPGRISATQNSFIRLRAWVSPEQAFNWLRAELFIKSIKDIVGRIGFEIIGNSDNAEIDFLLTYEDLPQLATAFKSQFDKCELTAKSRDSLSQYSAEDWQRAKSVSYTHLTLPTN